jgi:hypothetical protein
VLLQDLHRHAVTQVMRLELGVADHPAVHFTEAPDVLPGHRRPRLADGTPPPGGPEQRRRRADLLNLPAEHHPLDVRLEELGAAAGGSRRALSVIPTTSPVGEGNLDLLGDRRLARDYGLEIRGDRVQQPLLVNDMRQAD